MTMDADLRAHLAVIEASVNKTTEQMAGVRVELANLSAQVTRQNGRVSKSEEWLTHLRLIHAQSDGAASASKRYVALVAAGVGLIAPLLTALFLNWLSM